MDKSKVINYQGRDFAIGLKWKEITGSKPNILKNKTKELVHRGKLDGYGAKIEIDKTKIQIGFSSKKAKDVPSLAKVFAEQERYHGTLVLAKISSDEFWAVSITEDGLIVSGYDVTYNESTFVDTISEFLEFEDESISIFIAEDSKEEIIQLLGSSIPDLDSVESFDIDDLIASVNKSSEIFQVYNPSVDTIKQLSTLALTVSAMVGGYFFIYKEDPRFEEITTGLVSDSFRSSYSKYNKDQKKSKKSKVDTSSYVNVAKTELLEIHNTAYTNLDIINYFEQIFNDFPLYLVEWELNDIHFNGSNKEFFSVTYKRIENSFGYREQVEEELSKLLKKNGYDRYSFAYPSNNGNVVEVRLAFKDKKALNLGNNTVDKSELDERKLEIEEKLKKINSKISSLEEEALSLSFFDKRYGEALDDLQYSIESEVRKGQKLFKEIKKQKASFDSQDIEFDETLIAGSRSEMLSVMQRYSYYSWKEAQAPIRYPSNQGRGKKGETPNFFAQSYEFGVDVGSNIDVIGLDGLRTILLSDKLLNKPYIKIKDISFSLNNEVWSIKGETYEKL